MLDAVRPALQRTTKKTRLSFYSYLSSYACASILFFCEDGIFGSQVQEMCVMY